MNPRPAHRSFSRKIESLDAVFEFLREFISGHEVDHDSLSSINLAVEETFVNMVKHNAQATSDVSISLELVDGKMIIVLVDHESQRFDLTQSADVDITQPAHERPIGGLGIHFVKGVMDDVKYDYSNGTSTITLVKNLES